MIEPQNEFRDFQISFRDGSSFEARWQLSADVTYLDGHFPGDAVLPGVAIIDGSLSVAARVFEREMRLSKVVSAKFLGPVRPGQCVQIKASLKSDKLLEVQWFSPEMKQLSSLIFELAEKV